MSSSSICDKNWKNMLQEFVQFHTEIFSELPIYKSMSKGEPHDSEWISTVYVSGYLGDSDDGNDCGPIEISISSCITEVKFKKKIDSEQSAARHMFEILTLKERERERCRVEQESELERESEIERESESERESETEKEIETETETDKEFKTITRHPIIYCEPRRPMIELRCPRIETESSYYYDIMTRRRQPYNSMHIDMPRYYDMW